MKDELIEIHNKKQQELLLYGDMEEELKILVL
jgi:hypothetical protein